jgi:hypothetical protein
MLGCEQELITGWGSNRSLQINFPYITGVKRISAGFNHTIAILKNGTLSGWGSAINNADGYPIQLNATDCPFGQFDEISAADRFTMAIRSSDRSLVGWGRNITTNGRSMDGWTGVVNLTGIKLISAGYRHTVAVLSNGTVTGWGGAGFVGDPEIKPPPTLINPISISAGDNFTVAVTNDNKLTGWGLNISPALIGIPTNFANPVKVVAGRNFALALSNNGKITGWGSNTYGEITIPTIVQNNYVYDIAAGWDRSLALLANGFVTGWGLNTDNNITNLTSGFRLICPENLDGKIMAAVADQIYVSTNTGVTWVPRGPVNPIKDWRGIAISQDGKYQTAVVRGEFIYVSNNSGISWVNKTNTARGWEDIAISANGQYQIASIRGGDILLDTFVDSNSQIFISTNFGETWNPITNLPNNQGWIKVAISADGRYQSVVAYTGGPCNDICKGVFVSSDFGVTWSEVVPAGKWVAIEMSNDGRYQVICSTNSGEIKVSNNFGLTWLTVNAPMKDWVGVAISRNGQYISAIENTNRNIWVSNNFGNSWTQTNYPNVPSVLTSIVMDEDGSTQAAVARGGQVYVSTDFGVTWEPRNLVRLWNDISISKTLNLSNPQTESLWISVNSK